VIRNKSTNQWRLKPEGVPLMGKVLDDVLPSITGTIFRVDMMEISDRGTLSISSTGCKVSLSLNLNLNLNHHQRSLSQLT